MGDEEDGKRESAVEVLEAASGACMELVCAVEALDELLVCSELLAFGIVVFETDDGAAYDGVAAGLRINEVHGRVIGRVAVADEFDGFAIGQKPDGFVECDCGMFSVSGV